ncbi:hypothetical protein [Pseudolysinimonas sp.]
MSYEHIDVARIPDLARELAMDVTACLRFVDDFLRTWETRQTRVAHGVNSPVVDDALAALLTLSTSSAMVGAHTLSSAAKQLHAESRQLGSVPAQGADQLARIGYASCAELEHAAAGWRLSLAS